MKFFRRRSSGPRRDGCGFVLLTFLFSCFFLVLNSALIGKFAPPLMDAGPALLRRPGVVQAVLFAGPVILIFVEWWLVDLVVAVLTPQRDSSSERTTHSARGRFSDVPPGKA